MRILWHSSAIECNSGYGIVTRELVSRLIKAGHFVRIATKHMYSGSWNRWVDWNNIRSNYNEIKTALNENDPKKALRVAERGYQELEGVKVFEGTNIAILNEMLKEENFDYLFSLWDIWKLNKKSHPLHDKWVAYVPIDTEWISEELKAVCKGTDLPSKEKRGPSIHVAMSRHGARELNSIGIAPHLAPHGVDTKQFRPDPEGRKAFRDDFGFHDKIFLIGSVGLNYGDDRKGFIPLMMAFKKFHEIHPEARLYIHSHAEGKYPGTIKYIDIVRKLGIAPWVFWPHQASNDIGRIDREWLNDIYNGFDVFCLPTRGEGFGLPLIESASCGTPVITTATTTGMEFNEDGIAPWLIPTSRDDLRWLPNNTWRMEVGEGPIIKTLEIAYNAWKLSDYSKIKKSVREAAVKNYSWDVVWDRYWVPIWEALEKKLEMRKEDT